MDEEIEGKPIAQGLGVRGSTTSCHPQSLETVIGIPPTVLRLAGKLTLTIRCCLALNSPAA